MEIAVDEKLSNYAGGLGILAGDFLRSASDLHLPLVAVSLLNKQGYFKQKITSSGEQIELPEINRSRQLNKLPQTITIAIGTDRVVVGVWQYLINGQLPVYFLDTDLPANQESYRQLTNELYGQDQTYRLQQEIVLGRGAVKMLAALGHKIKKYHINEGHGILAALELLAEMKGNKDRLKRKKLRQKLIFTNHTPVKAGQDIFPLATMLQYQPDFPLHYQDLIVKEKINLTQLGVSLAGRVNGVSQSHRKTLQKHFPQAKISSITNGVHAAFWTSPKFAQLYTQHLPGWEKNNQLLRKTKNISLTEINQAHLINKKKLLQYVKKETGIELEATVLTLVFARRLVAYKQPLLLLNDMSRLLEINRRWPLQIIYAGKAHPQDRQGKEMIKEIYKIKAKYQKEIKLVFLENYNISLAKLLVSGADLWLNNPLPPNEACGTSGMKAALNGVPQISSLDGWWKEAYRKNQNGWEIKNSQAAALYDTLEKEILPLYYLYPQKWQTMMRNAMSYNAPIYNSARMVKEYWQKIYQK